MQSSWGESWSVHNKFERKFLTQCEWEMHRIESCGRPWSIHHPRAKTPLYSIRWNISPITLESLIRSKLAESRRVSQTENENNGRVRAAFKKNKKNKQTSIQFHAQAQSNMRAVCANELLSSKSVTRDATQRRSFCYPRTDTHPADCNNRVCVVASCLLDIS